MQRLFTYCSVLWNASGVKASVAVSRAWAKSAMTSMSSLCAGPGIGSLFGGPAVGAAHVALVQDDRPVHDDLHDHGFEVGRVPHMGTQGRHYGPRVRLVR